jgi:hypothetical protein
MSAIDVVVNFYQSQNVYKRIRRRSEMALRIENDLVPHCLISQPTTDFQTACATIVTPRAKDALFGEFVSQTADIMLGCPVVWTSEQHSALPWRLETLKNKPVMNQFTSVYSPQLTYVAGSGFLMSTMPRESSITINALSAPRQLMSDVTNVAAVVAFNGKLATLQDASTIYIQDIESLTTTIAMPRTVGAVLSMRLSTDGSTLAYSSVVGVHVYNLLTREHVTTRLPKTAFIVDDLQMSHTGDVVVATGPVSLLVSTDGGRSFHPWIYPSGDIRHLARVSADGRDMVVCITNGPIVLYKPWRDTFDVLVSAPLSSPWASMSISSDAVNIAYTLENGTAYVWFGRTSPRRLQTRYKYVGLAYESSNEVDAIGVPASVGTRMALQIISLDTATNFFETTVVTNKSQICFNKGGGVSTRLWSSGYGFAVDEKCSTLDLVRGTEMWVAKDLYLFHYDGRVGLAVYLNILNTKAFGDWCGNANQRTKCRETYLRYCAETKHIDDRCACVDVAREAGKMLRLDTLPISAHSEVYRMVPCISETCQRLKRTQESSYALDYFTCPENIVMCNTVFSNAGNVAGGVTTSTRCGGGSSTGCTKDSDCPIGSGCEQQVCKPLCIDSKTCTNGGEECIGGFCQLANVSKATSSTRSNMAVWYVLLGIGVVVIIVLVIMLRGANKG